MTAFDKVSGAGTLRLTITTQLPQDLPNNTSTVAYDLSLLCSNGVSNNGSPTGWSLNINGAPDSGTYTFDFRSSVSKRIAFGTVPVVHDPDGSKSISVSAHSDHTGTAGIGGPIDVSGTFVLPTIPRGPKVEVGGAWQQSICYVEVGGAWVPALVYVESGGAWVQAT